MSDVVAIARLIVPDTDVVAGICHHPGIRFEPKDQPTGGDRRREPGSRSRAGNLAG